ncbi:Membrane protein OS=Castellaniella defragrans (strain DSM / CCUG 39792 / 65Phen) OX=1437824 GN=BN940_04511 PE=4 SV=1 [Castellaniella denitrificans]|uniref:PepSY domain-containing protein n=1 Tax=Castellaniella sp. TaxID=1955812 RepID=UPI002AFFA360|nr:PepSY domain-containing protein [Castellaniella sp.]
MRRRGMLAGALALGLWAGGAGAHNHDRDMAERLQALGEVLPLQDVLARVARDYPGQVLKVEFEQEDDDDDCGACRGRWIYELKLLQDQGRLTKLKIDARTGETLWMGTRPLRREGGHP